MSDTEKTRTEQMAVGKCPKCGAVAGDALDFNFPEPSECAQCGSEIEKTVIADAGEVDRYV